MAPDRGTLQSEEEALNTLIFQIALITQNYVHHPIYFLEGRFFNISKTEITNIKEAATTLYNFMQKLHNSSAYPGDEMLIHLFAAIEEEAVIHESS